MSTRDSLRASIFSTKPIKKEIIKLFDTEVEIRQPTIKDVLEMDTSDNTEAVVGVLIRYCYVPGTDDRVFEEADRDNILSWPVGDWLQNVTKSIERLTGVTVEESEKK